MWVFFGILHNIALSSLIGLALIRLPALLLAGLAALALTLPVVFRSSLFDSPFLIWTGLAQRVPDTVDFVALFPWLGCVLLGMAAAKLAHPLLSQLTWRATRPPAAWFARAGPIADHLSHSPADHARADLALHRHRACFRPCRWPCALRGGVRRGLPPERGSGEFCARGCACARTETAKTLSSSPPSAPSGWMRALTAGGWLKSQKACLR